MTSRKWVRLFLMTLLWGGVTTLIVSFFVKNDAYMEALQPFNAFGLLGVVLTFLGFGFIFSIISQMGFFAYLTVHQFGLGVFKQSWTLIQIGLIVFALFDLVYFRYRNAAEDASIWPFFLAPVLLLLFSLIVARKKAKETNEKAFIPALFFMVVVTSVEWVPALRVADQDWTTLMIFPLLLCNTYQVLLLHRINPPASTQAQQPSSKGSATKNKKKKKSKR
ncbi:KinB-signaling pathway activation protein [Pontibacillus salicampi]|uniref:KinB-signaling pathway activation protein n=1 Tax=Pontibacillus salicampi TaxID=1449801 RepID=A0ABV6LTX9_9BACI